MLKTLKIAVIAVAMTAGAASAATFDFLEYSADSQSKSFISNGITLTVTTGTFADAANSAIDFDARVVDQGATRGLGSYGTADYKQIDGKDGNDVLVLTFSEAVSIDAMVFTNVDSKDKLAFGTVAGGIFNRIVEDETVTETVNMASITGPIFGTSFGLGAIGDKHNFSLAGLTVTEQPTSIQRSLTSAVAAAPVPLPASSLLLVGGLAGLFAARRKSGNV